MTADRDDLRNRLDAVDERLTGGDHFDEFNFTINTVGESEDIEVDVSTHRADGEGEI